jgi:hypothetical protein
MVTERGVAAARAGPRTGATSDPATDPWVEEVAAFLADLVDDVEVYVRRRAADLPGGVGAASGEESWELAFRPGPGAIQASAPYEFPAEFAGLPEAAMRALERQTKGGGRGRIHPSVAAAFHDVIIAEVIADRLCERVQRTVPSERIARLVADTLDYFSELAVTRVEGQPVSHGVVIATDCAGVTPVSPPVWYPGRLPSRKRTPLLFDGTESSLVLSPDGRALLGATRESLRRMGGFAARLDEFDELPGVNGALTAAASRAFRGVGVHLQGDQSVWIFDEGMPLFVRRTRRWRSIALESFTNTLASLGRMQTVAARRVARAAVRTSMQNHGGIIAVASSADSLNGVVQKEDRYPLTPGEPPTGTVDAELHRLLPSEDLRSPGTLARLAAIDGATIVDTAGDLLAYGAIVQSTHSASEGARTAAARALSRHVEIVLAVSQDGPITVFRHGDVVQHLL